MQKIIVDVNLSYESVLFNKLVWVIVVWCLYLGGGLEAGFSFHYLKKLLDVTNDLTKTVKAFNNNDSSTVQLLPD